ncbi:MAG: ATP-binding protein [Ignavibacteriaceae bacterium]
MNQKLQNILEIIRQSEKLDAEQKDNLVKAVKDADKEFEITAFKLERTEKVKKTTAILLEETIEELEQKRKAVEDQNRELEIEASLERVRAVAMGMKKPADMVEVCKIISEQLGILGLKDIRNIQTVIINEKTGTYLNYQYFTAYGKGAVEETEYDKHPKVNEMVLAMKKSAGTFYGGIMEGDELNKFREYRKKDNQFPDPLLDEASLGQYNFYSMGLGGLGITSYKKLPDSAIEIFKRFHKVFTLAYSRFKDIQRAEAQAREAVKQASLDRVRGEIASMRTSEDLNRITPVIWRELKTLEVPFIRCGVFIVDEAEEKVRVYLTTPAGKALGVLNLSFDANDLTINNVEHWRKKKVYQEHWDKQKFIDWTKSMIDLGQVQNVETYQGSANPPESLNLHFVPFAQGMLYVGDTSPLTEEKLELVKTLAEAFSIAYARYEDFKNLEEVKNKIETTLSELKSTQAQLIHAEKLASLGELTAGIAHEIKNPLNFVNNFSELSKELLDEIKTELENNNKEEILAILKDLKLNLEKINEHGRRADSIVKGMLLHSRGSSGEKTLTDINDLLDQYVNLAYHGMRAQNQDFNITIEKDYDETIGKINVVPQDISRVFLNIINNACYAAYERKRKNSDNDFSPVLRISTKNLKGKAEIKIGDNGNGIPENIIDKIFQPFFTTKPTGEGTGLGLSLSYDIITKVHGGELKVETKEGEGTQFIIQLSAK